MPNLELIFVKAAQRLVALAVGMEAIQRQIVLLILAVALAFAGAAQAMPLAHAKGAMLVEICADGQTTAIYLDQTGNPASSPDNCATCPECLSVGAVALDAPVSLQAAAVLTMRPVAVSRSVVLRLIQRHLRPETRGPPEVAPDDVDLPFSAALHLNGLCLTKACK